MSQDLQLPPEHQPRSEQERLLRKLESIARLADEEREAVLGLPLTVRSYAADQDIVHEGDRPDECCLVLDGLACSYKGLKNGRRQILGFFIPGDIPDLHSLHLRVMDHSLGTLSPSRLAFIPHARLRQLARRHPGLAAAFWRSTLIDGAIFREWMVNLGRRTGQQRVAHLLCEMAARYQAVGLTDGRTFDFPITQEELGDAAGLSAVHVNRVLQELRQAGLITWERSRVSIEDPDGLAQVGEFEPLYLHQDGETDE